VNKVDRAVDTQNIISPALPLSLHPYQLRACAPSRSVIGRQSLPKRLSHVSLTPLHPSLPPYLPVFPPSRRTSSARVPLLVRSLPDRHATQVPVARVQHALPSNSRGIDIQARERAHFLKEGERGGGREGGRED